MWPKTPARVLMLLAAVAAAAPVLAEPCRYGRAGELPVTMDGMQPLVHAAIDGQDELFVADSGAFFSILTPASAHALNLPLQPVNHNFAISGVGGRAQTWLTTVPTFTLFKLDLHKVPFLVAEIDLQHGAVGVLGQNVFGLGDVEYDLANGIIRIMRAQGDCRKASLAYWANDKNEPYSQIDISFARADNPHTRGEALLNGNRIRVTFDTGAWASILTLEAARRAGVTPESPGVTPAGTTHGIGFRNSQTWIAPFASFKIGDEEIRNTHLRIGDLGRLQDTDMLIGEDFFLSHRILAANSQNKLYFTYNGGPVFNLTTIGAPPASTAAPNEAQPPVEERLDAAGYARRGSASTSRRDYVRAIEDLTKAIELDPLQAEYFYERGSAYESDNQPDKALTDFSQAISLKPDAVPALLARAELRMRRNDSAQLITPDLDAADRAAARQADMRLQLGNLYRRVRNYPAAIAQYDAWIDSHHSDDADLPHARGGRCLARALAGQALDAALDDCNFAVRRGPKAAEFLDSRGLVYLRQGRYDKAVSDFDAALALEPRLAWALYGRGLAKQHLGQAAAAEADVAAARKLAPKIAEWAARDGIGP